MIPLLGLAVFSLIVCLYDWKRGVFLTVLVGFLQDPVRKLIAGEPVVFVILVGIFAAACFLGLFLQTNRLNISPLYQWYPKLKTPLFLLFVLIAVQALRSIALYGSVTISLIGVMSYIAPFAMLVLGYRFCQSVNDMVNLLKFYAGLCVVVALGVYLSFYGFESPLLGEVGSGLLIYDVGTVLKAHSGFMRSSEVAAWHLAAGICLVVTLVNARRNSSEAAIAAIIVMVFLAAGVLTGRRKMIMLVVEFVVIYGCLLMLLQKSFGRLLSIAVVILLGVLVLLVTVFSGEQTGSEFDLYMQRGVTVFGDVPERLIGLGWDPINWAIARVGVFGGGVGIASQGGQYFGAAGGVAGGSGEGGLGKIVAELGVPGLMLCTWVAVLMFNQFRRIVVYSGKLNPSVGRLYIGLAAFLLANIPNYVVASQAYGDLFILFMLGLLMGFIVALPKLAGERQKLAKARNAHILRQQIAAETGGG